MRTVHFSLLFICCSLFTSKALAQVIYVNIENDVVHDYLSEVYYEHDDNSVVLDYIEGSRVRLDIPRPAVIPVPQLEADTIILSYTEDFHFDDMQSTDAVTKTIGVKKGATEVLVYNLLPQRTYHYQLMADETMVSEGQIVTSGQVRMVYTPNVRNVRDLGGWPCAGNKTIKYGKLFRGGELNGKHTSDSIDIDIFINQLGIASEIDMRAWYNEGNNISVFGFLSSKEVGSNEVPSYYFTSDSGQLPEHLSTTAYKSIWRREFEFIVKNMKQGRPVYFHCVWGANRTGYLAMLLEGLLGVDYSDIVKDYELTTFSTNKEVKENIDPAIDIINGLEGNTLQDKFNNYFVKTLNVKQADIDYFRAEMLEENTTTGIKQRSWFTDSSSFYDIHGRLVSNPCTSSGRFVTRNPKFIIERKPDGSTRKLIR